MLHGLAAVQAKQRQTNSLEGCAHRSGVMISEKDSLREAALSGLGGSDASLAVLLRWGCCLDRPSHMYTSPSAVTAAVRYLPACNSQQSGV